MTISVGDGGQGQGSRSARAHPRHMRCGIIARPPSLQTSKPGSGHPTRVCLVLRVSSPVRSSSRAAPSAGGPRPSSHSMSPPSAQIRLDMHDPQSSAGCSPSSVDSYLSPGVLLLV